MARHLRPFLAALVGFGLAACSTQTSAVATNYRNPAIRYDGASASAFGVALAPFGAVAVRVANTASVSMKAYGRGQGIRVQIDGVKAAPRKLRDCSCLTSVAIANGLGEGGHFISVTNLAPRPLVVAGWSIDAGGTFRRTAVAAPHVEGMLSPTQGMTFYVRGASAVSIDHPSSNATIEVTIDDRPVPYAIRTAAGPVAAASPLLHTTYSRTLIAWGLAPGLTKVSIAVSSGKLAVRGVVLYQFAGRGVPSLVRDDIAARAPVLAVYGDSIGDGESTLGFAEDSNGFAAQLTALRGWRLEDLSVDGVSASCYGIENVGSVIAAAPDAVIVAFGTNDMIPGDDFQGCGATVKGMEQAMEDILTKLHEGLPTAPIFVQAILPSTETPDRVRQVWNAALRAAAAARGVPFVDPSGVLNVRTDYGGPYHPNDRGHRKIAAYWNGVLPSL
jgi:hypothetical protein